MKTWVSKLSKFAVVVALAIIAASPSLVFAQADPISGYQTPTIPGVTPTPKQPATSTSPVFPDPLRADPKNTTDLPIYNGGVDQSIKDYLCTPEGTGTDLFDCIDRLYKFGVSAGALLVVFFLIYAGYIYITGSESSKTKAKEILQAAFTGMAIMLGSFVLLNFINPELVKIKTIQPPIFSAVDLPSCEEIGFSSKCIISSGGSSGQVFNPSSGNGVAYGKRGCSPITNNNSPASIDNLKKTCWGKYGDNVVRNASIVAANESGGRPIPVNAGSCGAGKQPARCAGGEIPVFGVYQINLMSWNVPDGNGGTLNCPKAFAPQSQSFCSVRCRVIDKALYNKCYQALQNIKNEFEVACHIYEVNNNTRPRPGWHAWGNRPNEHARKCGF